MSTLKVNKIRDTAGSADAIVLDPSGGVKMSGICTATTFDGAATSLTQIPAANIVGVCTAGLTKSGGGFGKILQIVETSWSTFFSTGSTSFVDIDNATLSITPTSTSSKIIVMVNLDSDYVNSTNALRVIYTILLRDSTTVDKKAYYMGHETSSNGYNYYGNPIDMLVFDEPSTTSAITYKVQGKTDSGNNNALLRVNAVTGNCISSMIAMEVAG